MRKLAICAILALTLSPAHSLDVGDALGLPARAFLAWSTREQCLYVVGLAHGEVDTVIRIGRDNEPLQPTIAAYCNHPDMLEVFTIALIEYIKRLPPDDSTPLFDVIMALRWEIYPTVPQLQELD